MTTRSRLPQLFHRPEGLTHLRHEMDQLFDRFTSDLALPHMPWLRGGFFPRIDVSETEDALEITAELPGLTADNINVTMQGDQLMIAGEKKSEKVTNSGKGDETHHQIERSFGSFQRIMTLPFEIDADKVNSHFADGVLKLSLPKAAARNPKASKIEIGSQPASNRKAA